MKSLLFLTLSLFSLNAISGSLVCAGETLYSSHVQADLGIQPPPGTVIGTDVIVSMGKLLLSEETIAGEGHFKVYPYVVELTGPKKVLKSEGNQGRGSIIFKQVAVLKAVNSFNPSNESEIEREEVVCKETWAMTP